MKTIELIRLGIPGGECARLAAEVVGVARKSGERLPEIRERLAALALDPESYRDDPVFGGLAATVAKVQAAREAYVPREDSAPYRQWGTDLEPESIQQLENACRLPVAVRGALMPDAHRGYGLPIGGVLATDNAVIPYAVGVDIACRMKLSVLDLPEQSLDDDIDRLQRAIEVETRFGIGASFKRRRQHQVLDEDWSFTDLTRQIKDKAWKQLGTSGSGNHFVEFGVFVLDEPDLGLEAGSYLALLSHSGSRGAGATIASHYSKLANKLHPELPRELGHLAWLDLDTEEGRDYWSSMELMGRYAAANHACIHRHVAEFLGAEVMLDLENHHNFAWKEEHDGRSVIVHRKGATPAGKGVVGIIPGSMASSTYIVRGKGNAESMDSASHGAGRVMSRKKAKETLDWKSARELLTRQRVRLMSAGLDEVPAVYKNIDEVMAAQSDLVEPIARFQPRLVKMAQAGERPED